ncbi:MAG: nicotinate (nicotinamide) nucleotide adenylyltransferase [Mariprofundaceae bacterium]|nr:nicotinate (nicotinamide) nucleotide adenylyltransferase [Mariprofundaceae bacterium]
MRKIGVFGGSFDPPHMGHRALLEAALNEFPLDEIWVIPVGIPVHRKLTSHVSARQRLIWVEKMFTDLPQVRVLDWETKKRQSPTIETMRHISSHLSVTPYYLLGMDAWKGLADWVAYPEHRKLCNMLVFSRWGAINAGHDGWLKVDCISTNSDMQAGHVCYAKSKLPDISATQIRQHILTGKDVSTVLDARIANEIRAAYKIDGSYGEST